ncbi:MAG: type I-E CRISPR-associated protein Cas6/Cse3/CasE [Methylicorpusculum sp.]|uniref:type I-E CRISPR-associated protein Cas6/Cse3/CasE n=1 Tax=Methylicorpusculum sp. TaxID=2713644 RepID=UPI0027273FB4|nr:type I-E CRISPR-associated protein Cas6/Cse3/CasE [Methylicorpusculum sp.]MDO8937554.1 type I-E CRISPR-associated protein Cas6/Cse3/CasE [Methylicorpusculum sp.]MDO9241520.1 type I-E CRISPR-associated protein Cas6/Cse3/CasE [Methylicorpusculum sp.]MDP2177078.1 type I-E CRISPR-associated protein Cas6/Cse3/CasE [Methylicorpusculum sp.]MDP3529341.1 type I-E CRISPR-associated protein Cas6/Cse3/CasE [Methylicorpusculum sp.]MDZ4150505.1 type I-E CRISPR-associated protein Cas6/Cse3/CasE [Methylico
MHTKSSLAEIKLIATCTIDAYKAHQSAWQFLGKSPHNRRHFHHDFVPLPFNQGAVITIRASPEHLPANAKPVHINYEPGIPLEFSLVCSPTISRGNGKEEPCLTHKELLAWICTRSKPNGFEVIQDSLDFDTEPVLIAKPGKPKFYLNRAYFNGALKVTDSDLFAKALTVGIGRHKGLGFGMLKITNH